jgi:parallel beta-helix repeat protein
MRTHLAIVFSLLAVPAVAPATTFYVSPSGHDNASGTESAPFLTLQHGVDKLNPGDTLIIEDGTYAGFVFDHHSGTSSARMMVKARHKWGPKITSSPPKGNAADFVQIVTSSYITLDGLEVSGAPRAGITVVSQIETDETGADTRNNIIQNCHAHHNGGGSSAGRHDGIFTGFALNVTVQGNEVHDNSEHGIYVSNSADGPTVRGNVVYRNHNQGIQLNADAEVGGDGIIENWLVENNIVHDNGGPAAINLDGDVHGIARNNVIFNQPKNGISIYGGPSGWGNGAVDSHDNVFVNNTIYMPNGSGAALNLSPLAANNVLFNNIAYSKSVGINAENGNPRNSHDYNLVSGYSGTTASQHESSPNAGGLFVNVSNGDFRLSAGSAALDKGAASFGGKAAPTTDLLEAARPQGGGTDIGAYEFGTSRPTSDMGQAADMDQPPDMGRVADMSRMPDMSQTPDGSTGGTDSGADSNGDVRNGGSNPGPRNGGCSIGTTALGENVGILFCLTPLTYVWLRRRRGYNR